MAQIALTVLSVKERELPEADDDFAQISSQFDTIKELREDLKTQVERRGLFTQAQEARDALVDKKCLADIDIAPSRRELSMRKSTVTSRAKTALRMTSTARKSSSPRKSRFAASSCSTPWWKT